MPPNVETFHPSELEERTQYDVKDKWRKQPVDLKSCPLSEMVQYECEVENRKDVRAKVRCWPLVRLFRRSVLHFNHFTFMTLPLLENGH